MSKKFITLFLLTFSALLLTGCVHTSFYPPTATPSPTPTVQSTGDADKDLQAIDKELEQDTDLPDITTTDLGL